VTENTSANTKGEANNDTNSNESRPEKRPTNRKPRNRQRQRNRRRENAEKQDLQQQVNAAIDEQEQQNTPSQTTDDKKETTLAPSEEKPVVEDAAVIETPTQPDAVPLVETANAQQEQKSSPVTSTTSEVTVAENTEHAEAKTTLEAEDASPKVYKRAHNDPRIQSKPIENVTIQTKAITPFTGKPLDTALPANITHIPRQLPRPPNDPRGAIESITAINKDPDSEEIAG
jgi:ribonuclease E